MTVVLTHFFKLLSFFSLIVIQIGRGDYVVDPYASAKVSHDPPRRFRLRACMTLRTKNVLVFWFFFVLATRYSHGPWTDFDAKYAKTRRSAQGCAFSGLRT